MVHEGGEITVQITAVALDGGGEREAVPEESGLGNIAGSQPGQLCHLGDSGQCLETALVVTSRWEGVLLKSNV